MRSIEQRIGTGLFISLLAAMSVLALLADYGVNQLSRGFVTTRLQHDGDSLIAALTLAPDNTWQINSQRLPSIYQRVRSGHYFQILSGEQKIRSRSLWDRAAELQHLPVGQALSSQQFHDGEHWLIWQWGIKLQGRFVTLWVAEDIAPFEQQWRKFSIILYGVMILILVLLVFLQRYLLKRSFDQINAVQSAIRQLQQGEIEALSTQVPLEIQPLTGEINRLLGRLEQRITRSRTAMGNLAHELKRALQRLHLLRDALPDQFKPECDQALAQIKRLTERELKRARIAGSPHPGRRFIPASDLPHLIELFDRIYPEIKIETQIRIPAELPYDRDDILELIGNLLDNGCKFGASKVQIELSLNDDTFTVIVRDNGPGVDPSLRKRMLERGNRIDERIDGHGLGLSICNMIVESYRGEIGFPPLPGEETGGFVAEIRLPVDSGNME